MLLSIFVCLSNDRDVFLIGRQNANTFGVIKGYYKSGHSPPIVFLNKLVEEKGWEKRKT